MGSSRKEPSSYFLMIVTDAAGGHSAFAVAKRRLDRGLWPIYQRTRHRSAIAAGDVLLVYLGGYREFSQNIVAFARVKSVEDTGRRAPPIIDSEAAQNAPPFKILHLDDIELFADPVSIRNLLTQLSFIPKSPKWGAALMGGCRTITREDFLRIERARCGRQG
jgi:hypothetical protein